MEMKINIDVRNSHNQKETISKTHGKGTLLQQVAHHIRHLLVIVTFVGFIFLINSWPYNDTCRITRNAYEEYGPYFTIVSYILSVIPLSSLPATFANWLGLIFFNPFDKIPSLRSIPSDSPFICFRVVTRGDYPALVKSNADINKDICLKVGLKNFLIEVVSDKSISFPQKDKFIREMVVPEDYHTNNRTLYKARALNYCLERHVNLLTANDWIVHLDEETLLTEASVFGILNFISKDSADIGQGPISYANGDVIQNWITTMADCIRLAFDYAIFRFSYTCLRAPVFGLKGSYIVLRNRVEQDVGLDFGPKGSIAEDCYFALMAWSKGYTFCFIPGEMKEKSPFSILDFIRQRRRWFVGQVYVVFSRQIPLFNKIGISLSVLSGALMPLSYLGIILNYKFPVCKPTVFNALMISMGATFAYLYMFGAFMSYSNRGWSFPRRVISSILNLIVIPIAACMECSAIILGLVTLNTKEFAVVDKEAKAKRKTVCCCLPRLSSMRLRSFVKPFTKVCKYFAVRKGTL